MPRFVDRIGQVNDLRNWSKFNKMIDTDDNFRNFDFFYETRDRNPYKPNSGFRRSLGTPIEVKGCARIGSDPIDRLLPAYSACSFELTPKQYERNNFEKIILYADTPGGVYTYIETCQTTG